MELGSSPRTSRNPDGPHSPPPWSLSDIHRHTHILTHGTDAHTHSSCLPSTAPEQSATLDPTYQDSGPDGGPLASHTRSPRPCARGLPPHAVPSSSDLLVPLGPTEEEHPFPEPRFPLSLTRAFLCTHRMYFCILPRAVMSVYKLPRTPGGVLEAAFSATEDSSLEAWSALCKARSYPVPKTAAVSASFTVARGWWPAGTSPAPRKQHRCCEDAVGRSLRTTFQKPHQHRVVRTVPRTPTCSVPSSPLLTMTTFTLSLLISA